MANDPGLANDTCIFLEAISNDGGTHDPNGVWWLSPDIKLVGPVSGADSGDAGQVNPITVTLHRKASSSNCTFPGDESLTVEVWVANPSLAISPGINGSAARVGLIGSQLLAEGGSGSQQIDWQALRAFVEGNPQNPGPKCLVARVYPSSSVPNAADFFVPGDQHVAQRNLCVITSSGTPSVTFKVNSFGFGHPQTIVNPRPNAKLRAVLDLNPSLFVRNTVLNGLQARTDFPHIRITPLPFGFSFDLTNLHPSDVVDHSHPTVLPPIPLHTNPSFEAKVVLDAHLTSLTFFASLKGLATGEACIFHLIQTSVTNDAQGGLTLVVLRT